MNLNSVTIHRVAVVLMLCLLTTVGDLRAASENGSKTNDADAPLDELSPEQVGLQNNELIKRINALFETGKNYNSALTNASEEDQEVLRLQLWLLNQKCLKLIHRLADGLIVLEKRSPQPELRMQVEDIFTFATDHIRFQIGRTRDDINRLRSRRSETSVDERYDLEMSIAKSTVRLDSYLDMALQHIKKMEQLGLDTSEVRRDLAQHYNARADELSGRIALAVSRVDHLKTKSKEMPDDANVAKLLVASGKNLENNITSMKTTLALMDELGLDTQSLRRDLVTTTHDFSTDVIDTEVAVSLVGRFFKKMGGWLVENGPKLLFKVLVILGIIFFFRFVSRIVRKGLDKAIDASHLNLSQLARRMIVGVTANLVMIFGLMLALSQMGISMGPLLAGIGVAGFIVGFALQDVLGNFASGVMILLYRPFDVGDIVEIGGISGKVDKMTLVSTGLLTPDNQNIIMPNNKIWGDVIKNVTSQNIRRIDMVFGISYSDDIPTAERILAGILESDQRVLKTPEPMVRLHSLEASSVDFAVRPWVRTNDYWEVYWDVTRTVKLRFDEEGISIPFPQRDIHVYNENQPVMAAE